MFEIKPRDKIVERALLVGAYVDPADKADAQDLLDELGELVRTLGIPIVDRMLVHIRETQARYLLGTGKAQEICDHLKEQNCDVIIFDNELTPAQQRNWEDLSKVTVIDRAEIILDIFGMRAQTREARIQVDLARMAYSMPRLTRAWGHLGKQGGGIGAKGEGESQLEQDRRKIRGQIDRLKKELVNVRQSRAIQRKDRKRAPVPNAAIVGYTNAGKSSLLRSSPARMCSWRTSSSRRSTRPLARSRCRTSSRSCLPTPSASSASSRTSSSSRSTPRSRKPRSPIFSSTCSMPRTRA
jgi:GTP-binding protein HflX